MTLIVSPNWLACLIQWLLEQTEPQALADDRIYSEWPTTKVMPAVRVTRLGDPPLDANVYGPVECLFQIDVLGGPRATTDLVAETTRALLAQRLAGAHTVTAGAFIAGGVTVGGIRSGSMTFTSQAKVGTATTETSTAQPHADLTVSVTLKPARAVVAP